MTSPNPLSIPFVLVADDDEVMRMLMSETLIQAGFEVCAAEDGETALIRFEERTPDLVLLDVDMPGIDGFEVCRRIRRIANATQVPVLMVTGMDDLDSINRAYESGATDFIAKPINWPVLAKRAHYVLRAARTVQALRASEVRNRAMLQAIPDMLFVLSGDGTFLDFQPGSDVRPPLPPERSLGRKLEEVLPRDVTQLLMPRLRDALETGQTQSVVYRLPAPEGEKYFEARLVPCGVDEVLGLVRNVTAQRHSDDKIRQLAYYDSLTGMPNRQHFMERLTRELHRAQADGHKLGLLFLDVDGFKRINDTLGHNAGDHLLQAVAARLTHALRAGDLVSRVSTDDPDTTLARLGGDEFTVVLPSLTDIQVAARVAERIQTLFSQPFLIEGQEIVVTFSIGIAIFPDDGNDAATLLKHGDTAMYHAKDAGRNRWRTYTASLTTRARQRLELEADLRKALPRGEFCLHYQPQIAVADRAICGMEALIRWNHPERGLISPDEFIPVAEDSGLIVPIGEWVLYEACVQAKAWADAGFGHLRVAVNVSGKQLHDEGFARSALRTFEASGVDPALIELELTESILMGSGNTLTKSLSTLRETGVHFSIDDFGTGYSSMSYLKRFPIGSLKVDRSFVIGLPNSPDDAAITTAIITMAHALGLEVIAEGVETREQAAFLCRAGCEKLQGYLFSRPLPQAAVAAMLRSPRSTLLDWAPAAVPASRDQRRIETGTVSF